MLKLRLDISPTYNASIDLRPFRNQISHVSPHETSAEKRNELTDFQRELEKREKITVNCSAATGRFVRGGILLTEETISSASYFESSYPLICKLNRC